MGLLGLYELLEKLEKGNVQVAILLILLALYLLTKSPLIGLLTGFTILFLFFAEMYVGIKREGWKAELKELALVVIGALALWYGLQLLLNTPSPITAVVSCSMLPTIHRGDLLLVKGPPVKALHTLNISQEDLRALYKDPVVLYNNTSFAVEGSLYAYCMGNPSHLCVDFVEHPEAFREVRGPFTFLYGHCYRVWQDTKEKKQEVCVKEVLYKGKPYAVARGGDVVVYRPTQGTLFSLYGDIVHRAIFDLVVDGKHFYLTKGDNNNVFDIQFYSGLYGLRNYPVSEEELVGKAILSIPFLGYYKLFLSMYVEEGPQCKAVLEG